MVHPLQCSEQSTGFNYKSEDDMHVGLEHNGQSDADGKYEEDLITVFQSYTTSTCSIQLRLCTSLPFFLSPSHPSFVLAGCQRFDTSPLLSFPDHFDCCRPAHH